MELIHQFVDIFLHLDLHLNEWIAWTGPWIYVVLFAIVFCETGLVVTPFLPGDSLLFALGALTTVDNAVLSLPLLWVVLVLAALTGDVTNYSIGKWLGPKVFQSTSSKLLNAHHLHRTQAFYEKHGGKTIILARFIPIVRTFAPFVAGVGIMKYPKYIAYCVMGALIWVSSLLLLGHFFGNLPVVRKNFQFVVLGIIAVSVLPIFVEYWKSRKARVSH